MEMGTIMWIVCGVIVIGALAVAAVMIAKATKSMLATKNDINKTMAPMQADMQTIKQEQTVLQQHQKEIQTNVQSITEGTKTIITSVKEAPAAMKKQFKETQLEGK
ncbi:hypothetical protein [Terribacillus halophilus]|jgi:uncharacterized protein YoxC|uniref:hypothetical protein n=1 Tax=Terribacillus halophilus TaxID=361279 RepID=UPI0009851FA5|nr:hypothetical protein [Terribacillus halophilus]